MALQNLHIDAQRLWNTLMQTAQIGATAKGGICRLTLTDLDRQVRDWFKNAMRGARLHGHGRRGRQYVRAPAGQKPRPRADRHGLASRHPADRRQIRRRARRTRRARSHAHAARGRLRNQRRRRDRQLDQRRRLALCAGHARLRRLRRRIHARIRLFAQPIATATLSATNCGASAIAASEPAGAHTASARCSNCISSRVRSSKPKAA